MEIIAPVVVFVALVIVLFVLIKHEDLTEKSEEINVGMDEKDALEILGNGVMTSTLRENRTRYVIKRGGYRYGGGYVPVKKITVICKDGVVEEVHRTNI